MNTVIDLWPQAGAVMPGLYPWLRFERCTREQWVEQYGIDLAYIDQRAANAYLEGEAAVFKTFEEDYAAIGKQRPFLKQCSLEDCRTRFTRAAANLCASPIEQLMLAGLVWRYEGGPLGIWDSTIPFGKPQTYVVIAPQYQIGKHQVDFAISINGIAKEEIRIVAECDGHEFHEKTKEQAARDKSRDRDLQIAGWNVLRFSGKEIWGDHRACADQIDALANNVIVAQLQRLGLQKRQR
jgi:very-short-patch-repair endonuclease